MKQARFWKPVLALVALGAWAAYVIACRPAFSPDGSKVLVPVLNEAPERATVLLFDRRTGKAEKVFALHADQRKEAVLDAVQWMPDGRRALITWFVEKSERVLLLPLHAPGQVRLFELPEQAESDDMMLSLRANPPALAGTHLFLAGKPLVRLDLETGEIQTADHTNDIVVALVSRGRELFYLAGKADPKHEWEIGKLDPASLERRPAANFQAEANEKDYGALAVSWDGARLAVRVNHGDSATEEPPIVHLFRGGALERSLPVRTGAKSLRLGNVEWSPNGAALYATYVHAPKDAQAEGCQVGVMVIDPGNGQVDTIPLFGFVKKSDADAALALTLQLGVSPDGSMVAVSPGYVEPAMVKPADRALYVVDVKSPRHKVRKLPLPAPPKE